MASPNTSSDERLAAIRSELPRFARAAEELRDVLLAHLVLIGEIPAPTFGEARRTEALIVRLSEQGLLNCSLDGLGNGAALLPGSEGGPGILLAAHADGVFDETVDHAISMEPDRVLGCGVTDSLALAAMLTLPALLDKLGLRLRRNVMMLAAARGLGRGNLEGLRHALAKPILPIRHGICLEGAPLGRLSYQSIGMRRGEIHCKVPAEYDWTRLGASGAVLIINQVITRIAAIPLPRRPMVSIVLGSLEAGHTYDHVARQAVLRFEILGEESGLVADTARHMQDIVAEISAQSGSELTIDIFLNRQPGGIPIGHPLVRITRSLLDELKQPILIQPDTSELSAFIDAGVPAVTVGMTHGASVDDVREALQIKPLYAGMAQLVALLLALDGGLCDEV